MPGEPTQARPPAAEVGVRGSVEAEAGRGRPTPHEDGDDRPTPHEGADLNQLPRTGVGPAIPAEDGRERCGRRLAEAGRDSAFCCWWRLPADGHVGELTGRSSIKGSMWARQCPVPEMVAQNRGNRKTGAWVSDSDEEGVHQ